MLKRLIWTAAMLVAVPALAEAKYKMTKPEHPAEIYGGAGVGNFTQDLGDLTDAGVAWNGRVGYRPLKYVGGELAYQGINGNVNTLIQAPGILLRNQDIVQHQFTVDAKVGYPVEFRNMELMPYGLIGAGYTRLNAEDALEAVGLDDSNAFAMPVGGGVSYRITEAFSVDARFTYNMLSGIDNLDLVNDSADSWAVTGNVGAVFGR